MVKRSNGLGAPAAIVNARHGCGSSRRPRGRSPLRPAARVKSGRGRLPLAEVELVRHWPANVPVRGSGVAAGGGGDDASQLNHHGIREPMLTHVSSRNDLWLN
jgi:hypothetical protein